MWTKQEADELQNTAIQEKGSLTSPSGATAHARGFASNNLACIGSSLEIRGNLLGKEDLQIDGKVDGPISLEGQALTVGRTGRVSSNVTAREVVVYGIITGNLVVRDRVEIKKGASVTGDIATARIGIEDGAHFKGRIEIDRARPVAPVDLPGMNASTVTEAN